MISDTHGLLRDEALEALHGSELIIHAGDIGGRKIIEMLSRIAGVVAVRGNTDRDGWGGSLPETAVVEAAGALIYVLHDMHALELDPAAAGFQIVVSGHSISRRARCALECYTSILEAPVRSGLICRSHWLASI